LIWKVLAHPYFFPVFGKNIVLYCAIFSIIYWFPYPWFFFQFFPTSLTFLQFSVKEKEKTMSYQIFISLRFAEAGPEANALKSSLEARGISTFLCSVLPGVDISSEIAEALHGCQLAIIMGTKTYGKNTGVGFSTFEELRYIYEQKKPFFLVKMCDRFEELATVFRLGKSVSYLEWLPPCPMPGDLISKIVERLASVASGFSSIEQRNPVYASNLQGEMKDEARTKETQETRVLSSSFYDPFNAADFPVVECDPLCDPSSGKFKSIRLAMQSVAPGTKIHLHPGIYYEDVTIDNFVYILGTGKTREKVKIQGRCVIIADCRIENVSFFHSPLFEGVVAKVPIVTVSRCRLQLISCSISGNGTGLQVEGSNSIIKDCWVHNCSAFGVIFKSEAKSLLEDSKIYSNALANIFITERSSPVVRRNAIYEGHQSGIYVVDAMGIIEDNQVYGNAHAGIATSHGGFPIVRRNCVSESMRYGAIYVFSGGRGFFEDNDLRENRWGGIQITEKCRPHVHFHNNLL
jgi:parallel beta-helix repeat protein